MLRFEIPGRDVLEISTLLLDYNGTIARDGQLIPELVDRIKQLQKDLTVLVLTADTYGNVRSQCEPYGIEVRTFPSAGAGRFKAEIAKSFGSGVCSLGNGFNDADMFDASELSIAILDDEGIWAGLLSHADILVKSPMDGLDLLLKKDRLRATLRT